MAELKAEKAYLTRLWRTYQNAIKKQAEIENQAPSPENQYHCERHHYLMPDGHCTCAEGEKEWEKIKKNFIKSPRQIFFEVVGKALKIL